jgi:hypothetical protein
MGVRAESDVHVGYIGIEWSEDASAFKIEASAIDLGGFGRALREQSLDTVNGMDGLAQPGLRLEGSVAGLFVSEDSFVERGLCLC